MVLPKRFALNSRTSEVALLALGDEVVLWKLALESSPADRGSSLKRRSPEPLLLDGLNFSLSLLMSRGRARRSSLLPLLGDTRAEGGVVVRGVCCWRVRCPKGEDLLDPGRREGVETDRVATGTLNAL